MLSKPFTLVSTVATIATVLSFGHATVAHAVAPVDVNYGNLVFTNPETDLGTADTDDIGLDAAVGDSFEYIEVFEGVDAKVTVLAITNLEDEVDKVDEGQDVTDADYDDDPIWVEIDPPGVADELADGGPGSAKIKVSFYENGSDFSTPITLNNIALTVKDIDGGQSVKFYDATSYLLSSDPESVLKATTRAGVLTISETERVPSDESDEENWVSVLYDSASSITVTVIATEAGDAEYGLAFSRPDWSAVPDNITLSEDEGLAPTGPNDASTLWVGFGLVAATAGVIARRSGRRNRA